MTVILVALLRSFCVSPFRYHRPAPPASQPSDESLFQHFTTPPNGRYFTSRTDTTGEKEQQQKKSESMGRENPTSFSCFIFLLRCCSAVVVSTYFLATNEDDGDDGAMYQRPTRAAASRYNRKAQTNPIVEYIAARWENGATEKRYRHVLGPPNHPPTTTTTTHSKLAGDSPTGGALTLTT